MTAHPLRYFNPMACFNPWQSETLTRKHWSKSRKQPTLGRSKAKSFSHPKSLSAGYRKPKSGLGRRGRLRRRQSPSHARLVPTRQARGFHPVAGNQATTRKSRFFTKHRAGIDILTALFSAFSDQPRSKRPGSAHNPYLRGTGCRSAAPR